MQPLSKCCVSFSFKTAVPHTNLKYTVNSWCENIHLYYKTFQKIFSKQIQYLKYSKHANKQSKAMMHLTTKWLIAV